MPLHLDTFSKTWRRLFGHIDRPLPDGHVAEEQLRMVWAHAKPATAVAIAFALMLALSLRGRVASTVIVDIWLSIKLLVSGYRALTAVNYARLGQPTSPRWGRNAAVLLAADGALWGVAGLYVALSAPIELASFFVAVLACVSCVATFGLQVSMRYTATYVFPILAPTALGMLLRTDIFGWIGGCGLLLLLGLQMTTAARSERRLAESLKLRLQALALALEKDEALKLALRQSAVKTQFLANISHELRTPLHGILGLARLLHLEARDAAIVRRVDLIEASGTHLLSLINDLLDISRIEAGQFVIRNQRFDLIGLIDQMAGLYAMRAEEKGLTFKLATSLTPPCWVTGDPARYRQVLHNLLGNAIKFTQRGMVVLSVEWGNQDDLLRTEVRDSGVGIAQEDLEHIFQAFHQTGIGPLNPSEGAGLGLTIARDIARAMGGDITVESVLGAGSTLVFTARLPVAPAVQASSEAAAAIQPAGGDGLAPGAGSPALAPGEPAQTAATATPTCQVLIAEDNEISALIAMGYLELIGVSGERVHDGKEAVQHALREVNRPDLILMDCQMPTMDGYEATREIRTQEQRRGWPPVPVIALTATAADADRQQCLEAGMNDFLSKPYTREELARVIKQWTDASPTASEGVLDFAKPQPRVSEAAMLDGSSGKAASLGETSRP